jgi:hypothetical protein
MGQHSIGVDTVAIQFPHRASHPESQPLQEERPHSFAVRSPHGKQRYIDDTQPPISGVTVIE